MNWLSELFLEHGIAQTVIIYGLLITSGALLGKIRVFGISLGITWILFAGILAAHFGIGVDENHLHFLKEFGLILFVYCIGLQVGPGFFASLKKQALSSNLLAATIVFLGVMITLIFFTITRTPINIMAGIMSGAVTNTPGLGAAQAAAIDLHMAQPERSLITLAYAVAYPFGVFGIILALLTLKKMFGINLDRERELHRKLGVLRSGKPLSIHLHLDNKQLVGQPLRTVFRMLKEPIVVSRMYHKGEIITPTPDVLLAENDVLLVVASRSQIQQLKLILGSPSPMNLKNEPGSNLVSRQILVTRPEVTHRRLGDIPELHQHDFTLTRLVRAGIEMVPHGNLYLQMGDTVKAVGTEEGVATVSRALGNSMKRLEVPDLASIFLGIVLGVIVGSIPFHFPNMPVPVKIGLAGGPLIVALLVSRFGPKFYLNNYTTASANLMLRELGITLFLASVGLGSGHSLADAFLHGDGWAWVAMGAAITFLPLVVTGLIARVMFRKTYFEICGLLAGASTDPPALAFALKLAGNDIPSATYATVYPLTMILRIVAAQLIILLLAHG